ncbi:MAG TPA: RNA polymerase sigma factor FliA [Polyangia bacterium]|jgi:RNA polymerase sigma factor for flagellar operon FliA|nr:RNA polymerase sigma factor FliA [Polyangia bacterium]
MNSTQTTTNGRGKKTNKRTAQSTARRNEFVTKHFPLVEKVARRMARRLPRYVDVADLVSAGTIGLIEAAERFDAARCDRFEPFAEIRIRGAILDDLRARDTLSRDMRRLSNELGRAAADLANQLGRTPDDGEVADHLGVAVKDLYRRRAKLSGASVVGLEDVDPEFLDHAADNTCDNPEEETARREMFSHLVDQIMTLPSNMQQVLSLYYCESLNLKEIGTVLGVSESRICQIHTEATRRLRGILGDSFFHQAAA